ncbi:MAG: hypothetical protein LBL15_07520 [Oscillospiraceae bacterium]|nr:hypothetical protein [Oscillospiraceae bacterium]
MKKTISVITVIVLMFALAVPAFAAGTGSMRSATAEQAAAELKAWGLFRGVSDTDFDLYRKPTRTEAVTMLVRALGKEAEALSGAQTGLWRHPFTDVPEWADPYIGYAYTNGLTNGISDTQFGAAGDASANMYLTFMLRALGYSDAAGDFSWESPDALAEENGLLLLLVDTEDFYRRDVVLVSYQALSAYMKDEDVTLASRLGIDSSVHPTGAVNSDQGLLADYFQVDIYLVTISVDAINRALMESGYSADYTLTGVRDRIDSGEFKPYIAEHGYGEIAFINFIMNETFNTLIKHLL